MSVLSGGLIRFQLGETGGAYAETPSTYTDAVWHVVTARRADAQLSLFVDGVNVASGNSGGVGNVANGRALEIGGRPDTSSNPDFYIDHLRFFGLYPESSTAERVCAQRRIMGLLECAKFGGNLRRDIEVSNAEKDHVGKGVEGAESTGAILDHVDDADDAVEAFGDGVGEVCLDEGDDSVGVLAHRSRELFQGLQTAPHRGRRPVFEEQRGRPWGAVIPEALELVFQLPGPVDA
jgi:hypothetical protein